MEKLKNSRVAIFGLGGVGGYVGEALVRSGIGSFDSIDNDKICLTDLNRQIIATFDTVGQYKTDVMIIFLLFQVWELEIKLILPNLKSQIFIKQKYVL